VPIYPGELGIRVDRVEKEHINRAVKISISYEKALRIY